MTSLNAKSHSCLGCLAIVGTPIFAFSLTHSYFLAVIITIFVWYLLYQFSISREKSRTDADGFYSQKGAQQRRKSQNRTASPNARATMDDATFSQATLRAFFGLLAKVAKADGRVDEAEARFIKTLIRELFSDVNPDFIRDAFNEARDNDVSYKIYANQLDSLILSLENKQIILGILCQVVSANHHLHNNELEILYYTERLFGFEGFADTFFDLNRNRRKHSQRPSQSVSVNLYYDMLGVAPTCSDDDLKKAYRKKCLAAHPDRLGPNASPKLKERATEEMRHINTAYDELLKYRNIKK